MNIKDIRTKLNLTQLQFSNKYKISLRTLQEWEQGRSNPPSYLLYFLEREIKFIVPEIKNSDSFKVCIDDPFINCEKVYPIQQKKVSEILHSINNIKNVNKIILFGSSVSNRCHIGSDIDIYFDLKENIKVLDKTKYKFPIDYWDNFSVDNHLLSEITKNGVCVYGR